jgi:DNA-binding PadR family transcriptional regulator
MEKPQMTMATLKVLRVLASDTSKGHYGLELCRATDLPSGTIYPILRRLERQGWMQSHWESIDPSTEGRPRRRLYTIHPARLEQIRYELAAAHQAFAQVSWTPRPQSELA